MRPKLLPLLQQTCKRLSNHHVAPSPAPSTTIRLLSTTPSNAKKISSKNLPPRPKPPPEEEMEENFVKGTGPGGQKINKTNSAVQIKHLPTGIVVKCQETRSRSQNRQIARQLLADRLDDLARGNESRNAVVGAVKRKKKASSAKKSRRKYRKLEEEKAAAMGKTLEEEDGNEELDEELPEEEEDEMEESDEEDILEGESEIEPEEPKDRISTENRQQKKRN